MLRVERSWGMCSKRVLWGQSIGKTGQPEHPHVLELSLTDDEDRLDDAVDSRVWERPKKERLTTFHVSAAANPRNKRKCQVVTHESQVPFRAGVAIEDAVESVEETEAAASEDDDEPPSPLLLKGPGKARVHAKEDEMVMDIPAVPRKARSSISSSSRFSSMSRRFPENPTADIPRQKSPTQTSLNFPSFLQKHGRKLKPLGTKVCAMKASKVSEPSTISDQEVEVAEALFVLATSMPLHKGSLESKVDVKLEPEAATGSPPLSSLASTSPMPGTTSLHHTINISNGYVSSQIKGTTGPVAEAPKRKRPRVVVKQDNGRVSTPVRLVASGAVSSSVSTSVLFQQGETEAEPHLDKIHYLAADLSKVNNIAEVSYQMVAGLNGEGRKFGHTEPERIQQGEVKVPKQDFPSIVEMEEEPSDQYKKVKSISTGQHLEAADVLLENGDLTKQEPIAWDGDGGISKFNIDLMASPVKHFSTEEEVSSLAAEKQTLEEDTLINSAGHNVEDNAEDQFKQILGLKEKDVDRGLLKVKESADGEKKVMEQDMEHQEKEQTASQLVSDVKEEDKEKENGSPKVQSRSQKDDTDNVVASSFVSSTLSTATSSSAPVALAGWMGGLPHLGFYGPGAPPWVSGASLPSSSLDLKTAHSAMQLPHGALSSPVPRMKRCATHVYVAHLIYREQQVSRQTMWSAALCRAAPYNLHIQPVSIHDNEKLGGHYMDATRKAASQQSGPLYGYAIPQSTGPGLPGSSNALGNGATGTISAPKHTSTVGAAADNGTGASTAAASGNIMASHAQYLQAMMQQNGFVSFPFPFNGPPGQAAQFFNNPFFPHLIPPLPHLQPLPQQTAASVLPVQKQQQAISLVASPLQQQQLHLQLTPKSPSQQQHSHVPPISGQSLGIHSEKESTAKTESLSTAESRLNGMQRGICGQGASNLPNLNMTPSSLMLASNMTTMPSHDQDVSTLASFGGKQTGKPQQPNQGQSPPSLPSSMQQQFIIQTGGSGPGLPMKVLEPTLSQSISSNRGSVGYGPLGPASVSSMMGTQGLTVLPGSSEHIKGHVHQQPTYGGHSQQLQRSITKATSVNEDPYAAKGRDYADDKKASMKQVGAPLLSRVDMEVSSPSLQGSPTSGGGAPSVRLLSNVGRTLSSVTLPDIRSGRPASSAGSGQIPLLQSQPPKQAVGRTKPASVTNVAPTPAPHSMAGYAERVLPGNLGKYGGTILPFSGQMVPTTQGSKPSHASTVKVGQQCMSPGAAQSQVTGQVQQVRQGVPSTPPRMLPSVSGAMLSSGTLSMSTSHSMSLPKSAAVAASKSPSNGKGSVLGTKSGTPAKKPPVSGSATSCVVSPGQNMLVRAPAQQKIQTSAHVSPFPQQPSITAQPQRMGAKNQVYPLMQPQQGQYKQQPFQPQSPYRPQLFLQPQYTQQSSSQQQQAVPSHAQGPAPHPYQPSSQSLPAQHSQALQHVLPHLQQQFQPVTSVPQTSAVNNGFSLSSPSLTSAQGNMSSGGSSDGSGSRTHPPKVVYTSGGMSEIVHSSMVGQVSSPHSGSSHYMHLTSKPTDSKSLPDSTNREEMDSARRHLPSPSPQAAAVSSNPMS